MGSAAKPLSISILADAAGVRKGTADASSRMSKFASGSIGLLKNVGLAYAGFKAFGVLKDSVGEAITMVRQQDQLLGQTRSVLKSTGNAANVSAGSIVKMADAMERKSMMDAEQIQNGTNVLLTFTKVRNEAGKGNDIFNQGTQAALDMATALKTDMKGASILMGKALNDPIKGVAALGRSGVQFTDDQKGMIQSLVESGDVLGAQKIILKEVNTQFAGSAASAAKADGGVKRLKDMFDGFVETGVRKVLPLVYQFTEWAATKLPPVMEKASKVVAKLSPTFTKIGAAVKPVAKFLSENVGSVAAFVGVIGVVAIATKGWAIAQALLNASMFANPVGLIVLGVAALAAGLVYAYKRSETFRTVVQTVFKGIAVYLKVFKAVWTTVFKAVWTVLKTTGKFVGAAVKLFTLPMREIIAGAQAVWPAVKAGFNKVLSTVTGIGGRVKNALKGARGWLIESGKNVMRGLVSGLDKGLDWVKSKVQGVGKLIPGWLKKVLGINSPARATMPAGYFSALGIGVGMDKGLPAIRSATTRMAAAMIPNPSRYRAPTFTPRTSLKPGAGGASTTVHLTVNVPPTTDPASVGKEVSKALSAYFRSGGVRP